MKFGRESTFAVLGLEEDRVQCHECRRWYKWLSPHLVQTHGIDPVQYREKHGLARSNPLCTPEVSNKQRSSAEANIARGIGSIAMAMRGEDPQSPEMRAELLRVATERARFPRPEVKARTRRIYNEDLVKILGEILTTDHSHRCSMDCAEPLLLSLNQRVGYMVTYRNTHKDQFARYDARKTGNT